MARFDYLVKLVVETPYGKQEYPVGKFSAPGTAAMFASNATERAKSSYFTDNTVTHIVEKRGKHQFSFSSPGTAAHNV